MNPLNSIRYVQLVEGFASMIPLLKRYLELRIKELEKQEEEK